MDVSLDEQPEYYSFHHKLIQEYLAAKFLTQNVKHDKNTFDRAFPTRRWSDTELLFKDLVFKKWCDISDEHRDVVAFMLGMGAPIMDQVCMAYADSAFSHPSDDVSFFNYCQKEADSVSNGALNSTLAYTAYGCNTEESTIPLNQALESSHIVMVNGVQDVDLQLPPPMTTKPVPCQYNTRAVFIKSSSEVVAQCVMGSNVPITHLYMERVGSKKGNWLLFSL